MSVMGRKPTDCDVRRVGVDAPSVRPALARPPLPGGLAVDLCHFPMSVMIRTQPSSAQSLPQRYPCSVLRVDAVIDLGPAKTIDRPVDRGSRPFGGISLSPGGRQDGPANLRGCALWFPGSDAPDPAPRALLYDGKETAPPQRPHSRD